MRLDKYLKVTRLIKRRTVANEACDGERVTVNGRQVQVILDTGAPVSYVTPSLTEGLTPVDRVQDFNPMVPGGIFETPIFEFPASFAGHDFPMRAGHLPKLMGAAISLLGVKGVVGMEILSRFPVAIVDGSVWV